MDLITYITDKKPLNPELIQDLSNIFTKEQFPLSYNLLIKYGALDYFANSIFILTNKYRFTNGIDYIIKDNNEIYLQRSSFKFIFLKSDSPFIIQFLELEEIINQYLIDIATKNEDTTSLINELYERIDDQSIIINTLRLQLEENKQITNDLNKKLEYSQSKVDKLEDELDFSLENIQKIIEERDELNHIVQDQKDHIFYLERYKKEFDAFKSNLNKQNSYKYRCVIF